MDKYEYKVRADEIRDLISQGQYSQAAELADTIDWSRVKKTAILCTISDLYKKNRRYDDAIELLQLAYEKNPGGKDILYSLCELYIKTNNIINTVATYKDFLKIASNDSRRYILQYKIYEMEDVTLEERIEVLEELKSRDYREKWAYTLAYLYHRAGLATKCVEECDELILWFDEGKYVYMAMELKMRHQPLTPAQQEKYDHRFDAVNGAGWQSQLPTDDVAAPSSEEESVDEAAYAQPANNQPVYSQASYESANAIPVSDNEKAALAGQTVVYNPVQDVNGETVMVPDGNTVVMGSARGAVTSAEAIALSMGYTQVYHGMEPEPEIQVKPMDVGEYNTINLQQAIAEGVAEVLEKNGDQASTIESIFKADTKEIYPAESGDVKEVSVGDAEYVPQAVTDKTVVIAKVSGTFDATKTIPLHDIQKKINEMETEKGEASAEAAPEAAVYTGNTVPLYNNDLINSIKMPGSNLGATKVVYPDVTAEQISSAAATAAMAAQPPEKFAEVMTQEPDGQLSLVMPEDKVKLVSQITGQLSINDVMAEWNRLKYEREELNRKKYHELVKQQTGEIFNEFERAALNGVLETLEKESADAARAKEEAERKAEEDRKAAAHDEPVQKLAFERVDMKNAGAAVAAGAVAGVAGVAVAATEAVEAQAAETVSVAGAAVVDTATIAVDTAVEAGTVAVDIAAFDEVMEETAEADNFDIADETVEEVEESTEEAAEEIVDEAIEVEESTEVAEITEEVAETTEEVTESVEEVIEEAVEKEVSFEESLGNIFDNIDKEIDDKEEISEFFGDKVEDTDEPEKIVFDENSEIAEEVDEYFDEESSEQDIADDEISDDEASADEVSDDESSEDYEEEIDPRDKTYHVIGMNETTNHFINKKKKKLEAKAAEMESEKSESDADDDSDDDVRELTPEEKELFGPYINGKGSRKQLISVIENISMASYTGNIILTGGDGTDVSDLATAIMKDIKQTDSNFSGKVARVPAKSLNNKKMDSVIKQLANGALIIENASAMSDNTAASLYKCLDTENLGIIITLLDTERNMEKLLSRAPRLSPLFTARMNVKPLSMDQLVEYAVKYAYEKEYSIDQMGILGLHRMIEARQTATHSVNIVEVKEIVDRAIDHVNKKSIGHFFDILGGKRYDGEDMIVLGEKDFR